MILYQCYNKGQIDLFKFRGLLMMIYNILLVCRYIGPKFIKKKIKFSFFYIEIHVENKTSKAN